MNRHKLRAAIFAGVFAAELFLYWLSGYNFNERNLDVSLSVFGFLVVAAAICALYAFEEK